MGLFKSFSERERERLGNATDVFEYDSVPEKLRNQIIRIWEKFFGKAWAAPIKKIGSGFIFTLRSSRWLDIAEAIDDLNTRLRQYSLGYELVFADEPPPLLVRKDNEHVHRDIVIPALILLREHAFKGGNDEYRTAHRHYLAGNYRECLISCLQAFESTMKTICVQRKWHFNPTDTAKPLIKVCLDKGLLESFLESHMTPSVVP